MNTGNFTSLVAAFSFLLPLALGKSLRIADSRSRRGWLSAGGGIAIAYVFVDLLPQMSRMQETFSAASSGLSLPIPEYRVYTSALAGFVLFYSLENLAAFSRPGRKEKGEEKCSPACWVHILGFALYSALLGYLLHEESRQEGFSLLLYSLAMFFHFWIVDHSLRREHGGPYDRLGRWLLASGVLAGWVFGAFGFFSELLVPTLMGFIGGGVVINSVKEELPEKGEGRVFPFVLGAFGYALLLLLVE